MHNLTSGDIITQGTKLHYYRSGGAKPPLVLVHGISDDVLCWLPVVDILADQFDIIMVDVRAHGKSDAPEDGYTMETMTNELAGLITGLGSGYPFILGYSMGPVIALTLASLFPDLSRAILLEDPLAFWNLRDDSTKNG